MAPTPVSSSSTVGEVATTGEGILHDCFASGRRTPHLLPSRVAAAAAADLFLGEPMDDVVYTTVKTAKALVRTATAAMARRTSNDVEMRFCVDDDDDEDDASDNDGDDEDDANGDRQHDETHPQSQNASSQGRGQREGGLPTPAAVVSEDSSVSSTGSRCEDMDGDSKPAAIDVPSATSSSPSLESTSASIGLSKNNDGEALESNDTPEPTSASATAGGAPEGLPGADTEIAVNKSVSFAKKTRIRAIPHYSELTREEMSKMWTSQHEIQRTKKTIDYTVFLVKTGVGERLTDDDDFCSRGLENVIFNRQHKIRVRKSQAITLAMQKYLRKAGVRSPDLIAKAYRAYTVLSRRLARQQGQEDEDEATLL